MPASAPLPRRLALGVERQWRAVPVSWRIAAQGLLGVAAAVTVGSVTAANPDAAPAGLAVGSRVAIILMLTAVALYAEIDRPRSQMAGALGAATVFCTLWLLNGAGDRTLFSIGALCGGAAPFVFAYLLLAHPSGRLNSRPDRRYLLYTGGVLAGVWTLLSIMTRQPPLPTPLLQCAPQCPSSAFALGHTNHAVAAVWVPMALLWFATAAGTPGLLAWRMRSASAPVRRALAPVLLAAGAIATTLGLYLVVRTGGLAETSTLGSMYVLSATTVPLAILVGLVGQRLFLGRALAEFVAGVAQCPDPQALMARVLDDPSLTIAYRRAGRAGYVDAEGLPVPAPLPTRAVAGVSRDGHVIAAVIYDAALSDQERFVAAAGAAALTRLEQLRLEADLKASLSELAASRARLMETADAERRRLERDLHDGVQQQLVGLRIKLDLVADACTSDPAAGRRMLGELGGEMDDTLAALRRLAHGIYPPLLHRCGLIEALRSVALGCPVPASVRGSGVRRYEEAVEVAVYFCCLEALQNVVKHGGPGAGVTVSLWQEGARLAFEIRDTGAGFNPDGVRRGSGLVNMRDRLQAIGGELTVASRLGRGTSVRGCVSVAR